MAMSSRPVVAASLVVLPLLGIGTASAGTAEPPKIDVLAQSPAATEAGLQVICLFRSLPEGRLAGALGLTDAALGACSPGCGRTGASTASPGRR